MIILRTRIYTVAGFKVDVQESYELVKKLIKKSDYGCFIDLTLEDGNPASFQRDHIACFSKINNIARHPFYGFV